MLLHSCDTSAVVWPKTLGHYRFSCRRNILHWNVVCTRQSL